ncbi:MAG: hypothetical protein ACETWK_05010 [Candidatus Aminicenantaceae bacterium]
MKRKISIILFAALLTFSLFSCQKKTQIEGISLDFSFSEEILTDNLITYMHFKWKTDSNFVKMNKDFNVYVHFWHRENMLFQDDHIPEITTSKWEPNKEYTYTRRIYIPQFIDEFDPNFKGEEELKLSVGFFSPYDRSGKSQRRVLIKKIKVVPPPFDTPEVIYTDGWYESESSADSFLKQWNWTSKEARCIIDNPHRDALLVIRGGVNLEALDEQKIILRINGLIIDSFIPKDSIFEKSYEIKKEMLGEEEEFYLAIETDKTFKPAEIFPGSKDERELGVQISFIYFR